MSRAEAEARPREPEAEGAEWLTERRLARGGEADLRSPCKWEAERKAHASDGRKRGVPQALPRERAPSQSAAAAARLAIKERRENSAGRCFRARQGKRPTIATGRIPIEYLNKPIKMGGEGTPSA